MRVVRVVGPSGAGKTSLVESLVPALAEHGRVATVKSIHHEVELDTPGKDTHRHRTAGADRVVGVTPTLTFSVAPRGKRDHPGGEAGVLADVLADLGDHDVVVVEGFATAELPAILVGDPAPADLAGTVVARVADAATADLEALVERVRSLPPYDPTAVDG